MASAPGVGTRRGRRSSRKLDNPGHPSHCRSRRAFGGKMGAVRLFLALAVLVYHRVGQKSFLPSIDIWPLPGNSAVEAFFLVSGFFMSLVLTTRYANLPLRAFYVSRALRLYPTYLLA